MLKFNVIASYNGGQVVRQYNEFKKAKWLFDYLEKDEGYYHVLLTVTGENIFDVSLLMERWQEGKNANYKNHRL